MAARDAAAEVTIDARAAQESARGALGAPREGGRLCCLGSGSRSVYFKAYENSDPEDLGDCVWLVANPRLGRAFRVDGGFRQFIYCEEDNAAILGPPTEDERELPDGRRQECERGAMVWDSTIRSLCMETMPDNIQSSYPEYEPPAEAFHDATDGFFSAHDSPVPSLTHSSTDPESPGAKSYPSGSSAFSAKGGDQAVSSGGLKPTTPRGSAMGITVASAFADPLQAQYAALQAELARMVQQQQLEAQEKEVQRRLAELEAKQQMEAQKREFEKKIAELEAAEARRKEEEERRAKKEAEEKARLEEEKAKQAQLAEQERFKKEIEKAQLAKQVADAKALVEAKELAALRKQFEEAQKAAEAAEAARVKRELQQQIEELKVAAEKKAAKEKLEAEIAQAKKKAEVERLAKENEELKRLAKEKEEKRKEEERKRKEEEERKRKAEARRKREKEDEKFARRNGWGLGGTPVTATRWTYHEAPGSGSSRAWKLPKLVLTSMPTSVVIDTAVLGHGAMRNAYKMQEHHLGLKKVAKLPIETRARDQVKRVAFADMYTQFVARKLARACTRELLEKGVNRVVDFIDVVMYEVKRSGESQWYSVEPYVSGTYVKMNNNYGTYVLEGAELAQAFSHWTWEHTMGQLMVVDIQGVGDIYTDPQIHCKETGSFGEGNMGQDGMSRFFASHACNGFCQKLGLTHPNPAAAAGVIALYARLDLTPEGAAARVAAAAEGGKDREACCELCGTMFKADPKKYLDACKGNHEVWCPRCTDRCRDTDKRKCKECDTEISVAAYWYKMKGVKEPEVCKPCHGKKRSR